jgi:hypothetical protein
MMDQLPTPSLDKQHATPSPPPTMDDELDEAISWGMLRDGTQDLWRRTEAVLRGTQRPSRQMVVGLLLAILLFGAVLRFTGLNWDENQHLHPDERFLTMVENSLRWPASLKEYWDTANNPLNPYNHGHGTYVYGLFPLILAKALGQSVGLTGYDGIFLVGRAMNGALDLGSVLLVFLIARRL